MKTSADLARLASLFLRGYGQSKVRRTFELVMPSALAPHEAIAMLAPGTSARELQDALDQARRLVEKSEAAGVRIIPLDAPDFPEPLRRIPDPPPFLHVRGSLPEHWNKAVAVIGTRSPSPEAMDAAREAVRGLAEDPTAIVVSGLALGTDAVAHSAALSFHLRTVAVLAHGLHMVYPKANEKLAWQILDEGGCWLSEINFGEPLAKYNLVARDRLQSGLSICTVVIQSSAAGGSMHTALFALEQGRKLVAMEPQMPTPEWSGNEYLVSRAYEPRDLKKADRYAAFPRPHALKMSRGSISDFMTAGLRTQFVPKKPAQELATPTLGLLEAQTLPGRTITTSVLATPIVPPTVAPTVVTSPQAAPSCSSPFVVLFLAVVRSARAEHVGPYVASIRLAPWRGAPAPALNDIEHWPDQGDSDASLLGEELSRNAVFPLERERFEARAEFELNRFRRPSLLRIVMTTPLSLRVAVGAAKVAFEALSGEYAINTGIPLRPDAVSIRGSGGEEYTSAGQPHADEGGRQHGLPPALATLSAQYLNATAAGSDEYAALGYYALLDVLLGPVNTGLRRLAQARGVDIADLRRAIIPPGIADFDARFRSKHYTDVLKRFKVLRDAIVHGNFDVGIRAESLPARVVLKRSCDDLLEGVWSSYCKLAAVGVQDEDLFSVVRPSTPDSGKGKASRKAVDDHGPLLPS